VVDSKDTETKRKCIPFKWKNVVIILGLYFVSYGLVRFIQCIVHAENHGVMINGVIHPEPTIMAPLVSHSLYSNNGEILIIFFYPITKLEIMYWNYKKPPELEEPVSWKWKTFIIILKLYFASYIFVRFNENIVRIEEHGVIINGVVHPETTSEAPLVNHCLRARNKLFIIFFYPITKLEIMYWNYKKPPNIEEPVNWQR